LGARLWHVTADSGEIDRAIINLSLKVRDAMPEGDTLAIAAADVTLAEAAASEPDPTPGRCAATAVLDTSIGMNQGMQAHISEPFSRPKRPAKQPAQRPATVLGIVEQRGSAFHCESVLDSGTTIGVFPPAVAELLEQVVRPARGIVKVLKGCELVRLVEDMIWSRCQPDEFLRREGTWCTPVADAMVWRCARPTRAQSIHR